MDCVGRGDAWFLCKAQEPPAKGELLSTLVIGEESVVADSHEGFGQHVEQESPEEFHGVEGKGTLLVAIVGILPPEPDFAIGRDASAGNDTVDVGMMLKLLPPGVEDVQKSRSRRRCAWGHVQ